MNRSGTKKSRPATAASPTKKTLTTVNDKGERVTTTTTVQRFTTTHLNNSEYSALQLLLKEKEIELEHKLNHLVGLEQKQAVFDDLQRDVEENQRMIRETDQARQDLQEKFSVAAAKLREDTEMKKNYSDSLINEIDQLK